jgi:hypothetical protein
MNFWCNVVIITLVMFTSAFTLVTMVMVAEVKMLII